MKKQKFDEKLENQNCFIANVNRGLTLDSA